MLFIRNEFFHCVVLLELYCFSGFLPGLLTVIISKLFLPAATLTPTPEPTPAPTPAPVATCLICGSTEHTTHPPLDKNQNVGDGYHPGDNGARDYIGK